MPILFSTSYSVDKSNLCLVIFEAHVFSSWFSHILCGMVAHIGHIKTKY